MTAAILADFRTDPYLHQLMEFEASADLPARALFWQMRVGKTKLIIDTACHLYRERRIDAVVVLAQNGVHENWLTRELPIHHWGSVDRRVLAWRTRVAGTAASNTSDSVSRGTRERWRHDHEAWWADFEAQLKDKKTLAWFAFNSESMTRDDVRKLLARIVRRRRVLIAFDESQDWRTPGSKRTKMARALAMRCPYRRILTGTPVTNSPLHAYSQFELLEKGALGFDRYREFKDHFAEYAVETNRRGQSYPVLRGYRNLDELQALMLPWTSVVLRDDCHDLPDTVSRMRRVDMTDEQVRLYRELHRQFTVELDGGQVSVGENTSKLVKLQQVASGFLVDEYGDVHDVPGGNPRLEALSDEVYLCPGKMIVWCRFREDMDRAVRRLTADGHEVVQYHGRTSDEEKARVRKLFEPGAENDIKVLVGYPTAGIDLSAAWEITWYSHTFDAIKRVQADERATAMGGRNITVTDLVAAPVDEYILENVRDKVTIADALAGAGMRDALRRIEI